jgi:hypothetical protein
MSKRVLLDTNILIHREARTVVRDDIGPLFRWLDELKYERLVHPDSLIEIKKHRTPSSVLPLRRMSVSRCSDPIPEMKPTTLLSEPFESVVRFSLLRYIIASLLRVFHLTFELPPDILYRVYTLFNSNHAAPRPPASKIAPNFFRFTSLREITT